MPRVAKKHVDKSKRLKLTPNGGAEKNKKQKGPRVTKKGQGGGNYIFSY
jgi:hypothetical protein